VEQLQPEVLRTAARAAVRLGKKLFDLKCKRCTHSTHKLNGAMVVGQLEEGLDGQVSHRLIYNIWRPLPVNIAGGAFLRATRSS